MHDFERNKALILDRVDLLEVVSDHVTMKRRGSRWVGLCPFHSEKTPSFTVTPEKGFWKCFGCGKGGDVFTFLMEREGVAFVEALQMLADRAGVELIREQGAPSEGPTRSDLARVNDWAMKWFRSRLMDETAGREAREYVASRAFTAETAERFAVGLATGEGGTLLRAAREAGFSEDLVIAADLARRSEGGRVYDTFRDRLMFPIRDVTNRVVGFGGRTLVDDPAKYLNTRQTLLFDKGRGLYGIDLSRQVMKEQKRAILVEGYTDCIACHQAGFEEAVATLGTAMTEQQVDLIRRYCDEVILLFDADDAGQAAAERAIRVALPRYLSVRLAGIPDGKDPGEYLASHEPEAFSDVLNEAVDALEFQWLQTKARYEGDGSDAARREAVLDFVRLVAQACSTGAVDAIRQGQITERLARLVGLEAIEVQRLMGRESGKIGSRRTAGAEATEDTATAPRDGEQAAWNHLLGALLNEPGLCATLDAVPITGTIRDDTTRHLADELFALAAELGEFRLTELLARCHDPAQVARVSELARQGADRGNYEATLEASLSRIRRAASERVFEARRREFATGSGEEALPQDDPLAAMQEHLKSHRHYAPRRLIRPHGD